MRVYGVFSLLLSFKTAGEARWGLSRLSKMGLCPISSGAVRPPPAPLLLRLHLASGFVCILIGGKSVPLPLSQAQVARPSRVSFLDQISLFVE